MHSTCTPLLVIVSFNIRFPSSSQIRYSAPLFIRKTIVLLQNKYKENLNPELKNNFMKLRVLEDQHCNAFLSKGELLETHIKSPFCPRKTQ
jgi:hypothetical protein